MISEALKIVRFGPSFGLYAPDQGNPGNVPDKKYVKPTEAFKSRPSFEIKKIRSRKYVTENLNQCKHTCTYMYV